MGWGSFTREQLVSNGIFFEKKNILAGIEGLKELKYIFNKYNIPFFLDCGTLLGCIRDKGFINIDVDMDIGILVEDWNSEVSKEFKIGNWESSGVKLCNQRVANIHFNGNRKPIYFGCAYNTNGVKIPIDVYFYYIAKGNKAERTNCVTGKSYNIEYFNSFIEKEFYDTTFPVPAFYEKYLEDMYINKRGWKLGRKS